MRPLPPNLKYGLCSYSDNRKSVVSIPAGYVQSAIGNQDYIDLGTEFAIEPRLLKTVISVESAGSGFLLNEKAPCRPKILFEASYFYDLTPKPVSQMRPDLSSRTWNRSLYKGGSAEWTRLMDAIGFDEIPALRSASWGLGQIMGDNFAAAGCASVQDFVVQNFAGEYYQVRLMVSFIKNSGLLGKLKAKDWAGFACGYNGSGWQQNDYANKLANAYQRLV